MLWSDYQTGALMLVGKKSKECGYTFRDRKRDVTWICGRHAGHKGAHKATRSGRRRVWHEFRWRTHKEEVEE